MDEIATGDIIIYTYIDGISYLQVAESFEAEVNKVSYKNETFTTTDGDEYKWSGIYDATVYYVDELDDLDDIDYVFYMDLFGNVRIAAEPDAAASDYILITELYQKRISGNNQLISSKEVIAEVVDAEGEAAEYTLANASTKGTLNVFWDGSDLIGFDFDERNDQEAWTNVGAYVIDDDDQITLKDVLKTQTNKKTGVQDVLVDYVNVVDTAIAKGQKHFTIENGTDYDETEYVNVTQDTLIYYVLGNETTGALKKVWTATGYSGVVKTTEDQIHAVYAVGSRTTKDAENNNFFTAKVLVIELTKDYKENYETTVFGYSNPSKETAKVFQLESIDNAGATFTLNVDRIFGFEQYEDACLRFSIATLKEKDGTDAEKVEDVAEVSSYEDERIHAATIKRVSDKMDYIDLMEIDAQDDTDVRSIYLTRNAKIYHLDYDKGTYVIDAVAYDDDEIASDALAGHKIIYVTNKDKEIVYAIDVTGSINHDGDNVDYEEPIDVPEAGDLEDLWTEIKASYVEEPAEDPVQDAIDAADAALEADDYDKLAKALEGLNAFKAGDVMGDEWIALTAKKAKVEEAMDDLMEAKQTAASAAFTTFVETFSGIEVPGSDMAYGAVPAINPTVVAGYSAIWAETDYAEVENTEKNAEKDVLDAVKDYVTYLIRVVYATKIQDDGLDADAVVALEDKYNETVEVIAAATTPVAAINAYHGFI